MRSARTIFFGATVTTGVLGTGLLIYQRFLSRQEGDLNKKEKEISKKDKALDEREEEFHRLLAFKANESAQFEKVFKEITKSYSVITKLLEAAEDRITKACPDQKCIDDYENFKNRLIEKTSKEFDEKVRSKPLLNEEINNETVTKKTSYRQNKP